MTNYGIADEHGTDYTVELQGEVVVGSDARPEAIEPSIHVAASVGTPSDCTDVEGAIDVDVTVTIGAQEYDGEVTLAPQQQHDGRLAAYGSAPDYWISSGLLAELYAASERITGSPPSEDVGREWFRAVCDQIESAAVEAAS